MGDAYYGFDVIMRYILFYLIVSKSHKMEPSGTSGLQFRIYLHVRFLQNILRGEYFQGWVQNPFSIRVLSATMQQGRRAIIGMNKTTVPAIMDDVSLAKGWTLSVRNCYRKQDQAQQPQPRLWTPQLACHSAPLVPTPPAAPPPASWVQAAADPYLDSTHSVLLFEFKMSLIFL